MNKTYSETSCLNQSNLKVQGTDIMPTDTVRGCPNKCESCYAKRLSLIVIKNFDTPILVQKLIGKVNPNYIYRIGTSGDPATNWKHTEKIIQDKKLFNSFYITKLQSIKGYTGLVKKIQVSVDPLNIKHFNITLSNIKKLIKKHSPEIVLRIRSVSSKDKAIIALQNKAISFANEHNLRVLETRVRFLDRTSFLKYNLQQEHYEWVGGYWRPLKGLKFLEGVKQHFVCDLNRHKCKGCLNCIKVFK